MSFLYKHSIVLLISLLSFLGYGHELFDAAVKAHSEEKYQLAIDKFNEVIEIEPTNVSAYYNLGLSSIGAKQYGSAIWAFERVLKFAPNDSETKEKIEFCYSELNNTSEWTPILGNFASGLYSLSSDLWSAVAIGFSILLCISIIVMKRKQTLSVKRIMLVVGFCSALFMIFAIVIASGANSYFRNTNYAIITESVVPAFIDEGNTAKTDLLEGTRVKLITKDSSEYMLVLDNSGEEYFVRYEDLRFI